MKGLWRADPRATWWLGAGGLLAVALGAWGSWYLAGYTADFRPDVLDGPQPGTQPAGRVIPDTHTLGLRTYALCAGCHQPDGRGVPGLYPALAGSAILTGDTDAVMRIVLYGLQPDASDAMPAAPAMPSWIQLSDARLAAVLTYVRRSWGNVATDIPEGAVAAVREATAGRHEPMRRGELASGAATRAGAE